MYNPYTGEHTRYETEEEVKQAYLNLAKEVVRTHGPSINIETVDENGNATWVAYEKHLQWFG
jgi:hypothetical protein